ncbi:MAG: NAD(P)/FAD-dependent oxidoreductase [Micrococcales bacterium]|nr:NAD(P)/FAD-dependent oxidoreductase [Micrococcales bacterium]
MSQTDPRSELGRSSRNRPKAGPPSSCYDVVIVGGGHNGLTAAAYLARAGRSVLLLERQDHLGGATVSTEAFAGMGAHLSRYSYLVSLLPRQIVQDLGLHLQLRRRRYASYTPVPAGDVGLLVDHGDRAATAESFRRIGAGGDLAGWHTLYERMGRVAAALWPTFTGELPRRGEILALAGAERDVVEQLLDRPLGELIERYLAHDVTRGVALTDGLIGTFGDAHEPDLRQNVCFLYHVIGGGTGDWDVPVAGMGALSSALIGAATQAGAQLRTGCEITAVSGDRVTWRSEEGEHFVDARHILWAAAPAVLDRIVGRASARAWAPPQVEGAQVKINLLLRRLPHLREGGLAPEAAFGGTFHINETYSQLAAAYASATSGGVPDPVPAEIYCHSLTDPSILEESLRESGAHTLTVFALHTPHRLVADLCDAKHDAMRTRLERAVLDSLSSVLAEPIDDVLATDLTGRPCVETKTTRDLQDVLAMPGGNIFHEPLTWPFAQDDEPMRTPAERWGVESGHDGILLAGAGSRRAGGVSGLGGYHAARALLAEA